MSAEAAFEKFLQTVELDEALEARAAVGRALARRLDEADSTRLAGQAVVAIPAIAKELRAVIDDIQERTAGDDPFLDELGLGAGDAEVGDTSH